MAYTPTVWATGDVITAEKLNKAEQGIADATTIICQVEFNENRTEATIDTEYSVIKTAFLAGKNIVFQAIDADNGEYTNMILSNISDAVDDYPAYVGLYGRGPAVYPEMFAFNEVNGVLTYSKQS